MAVGKLELLVVTGLSGAGRSTAAHALEDHSWYVVDNLPPSMMPELLRTVADGGFPKVAVVLDARSRSQFPAMKQAFDLLKQSGVAPKILFLEADDAAIVRRQESARRPLPLQGDDTLLAGVRREREMLASLRSVADMVVDTSKMDVHQLARRVLDLVSEGDDLLRLTVMSFGHKNGVPVDADVVLDVRFLPNPHWVPELRPLNGLSAAVSDYVLGQDDAEPYLCAAAELVRLSIPGFQRESKQHLTVALGCTGGKHRSVAMAVALAARLSDAVSVKVFHRDLGLE